MEISVVVPVYGCPAALNELHRRLTDTLSQISDEYEIILVNDACPKNSWEVIEQICASDKKVVGIELSRNFGQPYAITAGLDASKGNWVVVMDCDLQDRPEEILKMYEKAKEGYDIVFARREHRQDRFLKKFVSKIFYSIYSYASNTKYDPTVANFSIASRRVIDSYCSMREAHRAYSCYITWMGFRQASVNVEHNERFEGKSSYNFRRKMKLALETLVSQSDKILKFTVMLGFLITIASLCGAIGLVINYFISHTLSGWTSTIVTLCFFGGIIETSIGLVGIYVGNTFMQTKQRPLYIVRTAKNYKAEEKGKHIMLEAAAENSEE